MENIENAKPIPEIELCVLCGRDTGYTVETPINYRRNYIEGAGQMCDDCSERMSKGL